MFHRKQQWLRWLEHSRRTLAADLPAIVFLSMLSIVGWVIFHPVAVSAQETPTSTPDADGNIFVEVQPNDSLWSIAARANLSLPDLLELNNIDENHVLQPGDLLLIRRVTPPATPTSDIPTPTLPPPTLTPTPIPIHTAICITAFEDLNQDGNFDPGESLRSEVAFTIFNDQTVVNNYISDGVSEPFCLEGLEPGTYHVTRSIARGEILTTAGDWAMELTQGAELNLAFGSYSQDVQLGIVTPDDNAEFATRIAATPILTSSTEDVSGESATNSNTVIIVLLGIGIFALLLGLAVLVFWLAYGRNRRD